MNKNRFVENISEDGERFTEETESQISKHSKGTQPKWHKSLIQSLWGVQWCFSSAQLGWWCVDWAHTHTHTPPRVFNPLFLAELHPRAARLLGNTLRADYSTKLVWGDPTHLSWGDAVVWKSNRPLIPKPNKSKWGFGLSCCWNHFTFLSCPSFHMSAVDLTFVLSQFGFKIIIKKTSAKSLRQKN